jgi:hypothetical protein
MNMAKKKAKNKEVLGLVKGNLELVPLNIIEANHPRKAGAMIKITTTSEITPTYVKAIGEHIKMVEATSQAVKLVIRK